MTSSEPKAASSESEARPPEAYEPLNGAAIPVLLAAASRALAQGHEHDEDADLLARLARVVVPLLGDLVVLYAQDDTNAVRLAGAAPADATVAQRLRHRAELSGAPLAALSTTAVGAFHQAVGIASEVVAAPVVGAQPGWLLALGSADPARRYGEAERAAIEVLGALVAARRAGRRQAAREADLRQQVETVALAGRELAHALNNDLTMPVGVVELLLDRSGFPPELREMLQAAAKDLTALEQHVRDFHGLMRASSTGVDVGSPSTGRPPGR
jgi:signal transduction histidine kinase